MKPKEDKPKDSKPKDDRKSFPLRLPKTTLKALKLRALEQETSVQRIVETLVDRYLTDLRPGADR